MNRDNPKPTSKKPIAPQIHRPQAKRVVVQAKMNDRPGNRTPPAAPPVYHPQPVPRVLQQKSQLLVSPVSAIRPGAGTTPIQRKIAGPRIFGVIQRAIAATCGKHPNVEIQDGVCYECVIADSKVKQKPDQQKKKVEVTVTFEDFARDNARVARDCLSGLGSTTIVHRGNKVPANLRNPTADDLVNHENSRAPVWFTVGDSGTGSAIEAYKYHHVIRLNRSVSEIIERNAAQTINHSEGVSGEGSWNGFVIKSNESGCFAVSRSRMDEFYRNYVTAHQVRVTK